jgi:hypothetical protein
MPWVIISALGCKGVSLPSDAAPNDRELEQAFSTVIENQLSVPLSGQSPRRLHIYIDSSKSMRGFAASPDAKYVEVLDRLLDDASSAGFQVATHSFSENVEVMNNSGSAVFLDPTFYRGLETSFPKLFRHVANERGQGTISIIVSDMVQSGKSGDQRALLGSLQEVTQSKPELQLLAFRSSFKGTYYIEGRRMARPHLELSLDGTSRENSRPFYVLIIADNREDLAAVRQYLQPQMDRVTGEQLPLELNASRPALTVESIELPPTSSEAPVVWHAFEPSRWISAQGRKSPPRLVLSFLEVRPPIAEPVNLRLRIKVKHPPKEALIRSAEALRFDMRACSFTARRPSKVVPVSLPWEASLSREDRQGTSYLDVSYQFSRPQPQTWDAYHIQIIPGPGNLQPPVWVLDWSTIDDSPVKNGHRTLKLDVFIDTILRSIKEEVPFSETYIVLGRGD